jgi:adenylate cyclase
MTPDQVKRKLAAILSADVQGYSRLMGEDEEGTIRALKAHLEVISRSIAQHQGRVVGTGGDSVLAEFTSVVDAVRCGVAIQGELAEKNKELAADRGLEFRIGVNLGDVVDEGDTILGDGVNIAARLEGLAEAGGICISGTAFDQVRNKLELGYEYLGEQTVKNIALPVRAYKVLMEPEAVGKVVEGEKPKPKKWGWKAIAGVAVIVLVAIGMVWNFYWRAPGIDRAEAKKMAFPLPEQPSIAVLPFVNMSGDPRQEFFSEGISEDIITALSKIPRLFVIARNSSFIYKGKPIKVHQVSEELGVRYVLEGSVQKSRDRVRITAQLIDALNGHHLWAERYDRNLKDVFTIQDEITLKILTAMRVKLVHGEEASTYEKYFKGKKGLDCYLKFLEGVKNFQILSIDGNNTARRITEEAIKICPDNPMVHLLLGWICWGDLILGSSTSPRETFVKAMEIVQKTLAVDDNIYLAHCLLSSLYLLKKEYDKAIVEGERAVALVPNGALAHEFYSTSLLYSGRPKEAIPVLQKAIRLNPYGPTSTFSTLGTAYRFTGQFEESVSAYRKALQRSPNNIFAHTGLTATYSLMGREREARDAAAEILKLNPKFSLDSFAMRPQFKDQSENEKVVLALRQAGLK